LKASTKEGAIDEGTLWYLPPFKSLKKRCIVVWNCVVLDLASPLVKLGDAIPGERLFAAPQ
jgi:hypothetical protein